MPTARPPARRLLGRLYLRPVVLAQLTGVVCARAAAHIAIASAVVLAGGRRRRSSRLRDQHGGDTSRQRRCRRRGPASHGPHASQTVPTQRDPIRLPTTHDDASSRSGYPTTPYTVSGGILCTRCVRDRNSVGTGRSPPDQIDPMAMQAMRKAGIDITAEQPRKLDPPPRRPATSSPPWPAATHARTSLGSDQIRTRVERLPAEPARPAEASSERP